MHLSNIKTLNIFSNEIVCLLPKIVRDELTVIRKHVEQLISIIPLRPRSIRAAIQPRVWIQLIYEGDIISMECGASVIW